jgi:hypothetical protein
MSNVQFDAFVPDGVDGLRVGLGAVLVFLEPDGAERVTQPFDGGAQNM